MIKTGDKVIIVEPAYSTFNPDRQVTYWNAKVQLPNGTQKLASLFESACELFVEKWGNDTVDWTGHTIVCEILIAKTGNPYISMKPSDDEKIEITTMIKTEMAKAPIKTVSTEAKTLGYPTDEIQSKDIPF